MADRQYRPMTRGEVIGELDRIATRLRDVAFSIRRLTDNLRGDGRGRDHTRPYDVPAEDAEVVAERYGVEDHSNEGEAPDWFKEKFQGD